jgi:hypothetical protein
MTTYRCAGSRNDANDAGPGPAPREWPRQPQSDTKKKKTVPIVHLQELGDSTNATFRQHGGGEVPVRDGWCTAIIVMKLLVLCKIAVSGDNVVYSLATGDYSHAVLMRVLTDV